MFVIPKLGAPPVPGDSQVGEYYQAMLPQSMALKGAFIRSSGGSESAIETEQNALGARTKPGVRLILERVTCLLARGSDTHDRLVLKAFEDGGLRELGAKAQFHLDPGESQDVKLLLVGEKSVTIQLCELDRMNRPEVFGEVNITASGPGFEVFSGTSDGSNFKYVIEWR